MVKQGFSKKPNLLILLSCVCLILMIILFSLIYRDKRLIQNFKHSIDTLTHQNEQYQNKITQLSTEITEQQKKLNTLSEDSINFDSVVSQYKIDSIEQKKYYEEKFEALKEKSKYTHSSSIPSNVTEKKLAEFKVDKQKYQQKLKQLTKKIDLQNKAIALLRSRHDLPILFFLQSSLVYYPSDHFKDSLIKEEFNRIIAINGWPHSSEHLVALINNSPRIHFKGIKWAQQKMGCPVEASYLLLAEHNIDPKKSSIDDLITIVYHYFKQYPLDLQHCSDHLRSIIGSEAETLSLLSNTIDCLIENHRKNSKKKKLSN